MSTITPSERPLRKDAERNRQRILEAAGELFALRGLGVTLDDIAHHAGVGVGTVYRRFPDKELLLEQRVDQQLLVGSSSASRPSPRSPPRRSRSPTRGTRSASTSSRAPSCRPATAASRSS
jgi:AcrR family transcriptional regulator